MRYQDKETLEEVLKPQERDSNFYLLRFLSNYKNFVDRERIRTDRDNYLKDIMSVGSLLDKIDVNLSNNILFVYKDDISDMLFLNCFANCDNVLSNIRLNSIEIADIYWGNRGHDNNRRVTDDIIISEQDIKEDVMCLYSDDFITNWKSSNFIIPVTIETRYHKTNRKGKKLISWIFYKGTIDSMKENDSMVSVLSLFEQSEGNGFDIIDLNNTGSSIELKGKPIEEKPKEKTSLKDIY